MSHVRVEHVSLTYLSHPGRSPFTAVEDVDFEVGEGEFLTVVGPSGCGKSSLLLAIDGLIPVAQGQIAIRGQPVRGPGRDRAMVFQEFALLPWRTVEENLWFGLELQRVPRQELKAAADKYLALVGLTAFRRHYPHQLSGGMRQRIGIARALAVRPEILLMDEPFGALDEQTREIMQAELLRIWEQERKTVVFVTHSLEEAVYLGDRVVVMTRRPGRIKAILPVPLPRPRHPQIKGEPEFARLKEQLWELLQAENTGEL